MSAVLETPTELDQLFRAWPALRDAVQPPPLPRVDGQHALSCANDWNEFTATLDSFRFRESDPANQCGPFQATGECLTPFSQPGDLIYTDPTLQPQDGDFVMVAFGQRTLSSDKFQGAAKLWREKYGTDPTCIATKRLRRLGSHWLLCVRRSFFWLDPDDRILGVVVRRERDGFALHAPAVACIDPNAATQVESVEDDSVSLINGGGAILSKSLSAVGLSYLLQVTATFDFWRTTAGTPEVYLDINGNSTQLGVSQSAFPTATASPGQRITLQCEVPITPSDEVSLTAAIVWTGMQPSGTAEVRNAALRCEKIKR
jgi:hypothetical protein